MAGRRAIHDFGGSRGRSDLAESRDRGRGGNANADRGCYGNTLYALNNAVLASVAFWHLARRKAKIRTLFSANPYHVDQFLFFPKGLLLFFLLSLTFGEGLSGQRMELTAGEQRHFWLGCNL